MKTLFAGIIVGMVGVSAAIAADRSTCSGNQDICITGSQSRGQGIGNCVAAYNTCLRSGRWATSGPNGRTLENVAKR